MPAGQWIITANQRRLEMQNIVVMATGDYAKWYELCLDSIVAFHPEARVWLYDLSDAPSEALATISRRARQATLVHYPESEWAWPAWIDAADFDFLWPNCTLKDRVKMVSRSFRHHVLGKRNDEWILGPGQLVRRKRRFMRIVAQKPYILKRVLAESAGPVAFVDADAVLLGNIDDALPAGVSAGVTVDEPQLARVGQDPGCGGAQHVYPYAGVSTGFLTLRDDASAMSLVDAWIEEMRAVEHLLVEQTALANLLYRSLPDLFASDDYQTDFPLPEGRRMRLAILPCRLYNFWHFELDQGEFPAHVKVVHFGGWRKQAQHFAHFSAMARSAIRRGSAQALSPASH
jgi:hypothetical protein